MGSNIHNPSSHPSARPSTYASAHLARALLLLDDDRIVRDCEVHTYRASGPGGQKRNKTSSAVRLVHRPSGLAAIAEESRSQHENKAKCVGRLREAAAVRDRLPLPKPVIWPDAGLTAGGRLNCGARNPHRFVVLALLLDALAQAGGKLSEAAGRLGITSSSLTSFLADHPKGWIEANRIRQTAGLSPLRK